MPRIIFFGSDQYSIIVFNKLLDAQFKIVGVVTTPQSPLEKQAEILFEIKFSSIKKFDSKSCQKLKDLKGDVGILASYGKILPKEVLALFKKGILNVHPSLLPKYRGASPVQYAILNGEKETGVTILKMDKNVDHGPIIAQFKEEIKDNDTAETLYSRLFEAGAKVLVTIIPAWVEGRIKPRPQDDSKATYAPKLTRDDGKINWKKSDEEIERFIRAMTPWPGAYTNLKFKMKNLKMKIIKAHLENKKLVIDQVQLPGKKPITWKQFLAGHPTYQFSWGAWGTWCREAFFCP